MKHGARFGVWHLGLELQVLGSVLVYVYFKVRSGDVRRYSCMCILRPTPSPKTPTTVTVASRWVLGSQGASRAGAPGR